MKKQGVDLTAPFQEHPEEVQQLIWEGSDHVEGVRQYFDYLETKRYKLHVRVLLSRYRSPATCPTCHGSRLKPAARLVKLAGQDIVEIGELTIEAAADWFERLALPAFDAEVAKDILRQLHAKLNFLLRVGLSYLTLSRQTKTLSGGEAQRIALANQLGSRLVGTLYVLDEPTIGLHARDTDTLAGILRDLANHGNIVVVVEHDPSIIQAADHIVEMGPGSGEQGGHIVCSAPRDQFLADPASLTARYLRGENRIPLPKIRRSGNGKVLSIAGAAEHNLKNLVVRIPLHMLVCVTGVSGSGKSTLIEKTLYNGWLRKTGRPTERPGLHDDLEGYETIGEMLLVDQQPLGRTPRANLLTYTHALDPLRKMLASTPEAVARAAWPAGLEGLEIGCGLGLAGLAALVAGVERVTFSDYDTASFDFVARNLELNQIDPARARFEMIDWRDLPDARFPLVLGADVMYERRLVPLVADEAA